MNSKKKIIIFSDGSTNFDTQLKFSYIKNKKKKFIQDLASMSFLKKLANKKNFYSVSSKNYKKKYS